MLHIVLLILKIIGIILLVLLLLVLALILIVLCTPVRYRLEGAYEDDKPDIYARVGIWFSLIAAYVTFDDEGLAVYLKIFGKKKNIITPEPKTKETEGQAQPNEGPVELEFEDVFDNDDNVEFNIGPEPEDDLEFEDNVEAEDDVEEEEVEPEEFLSDTVDEEEIHSNISSKLENFSAEGNSYEEYAGDIPIQDDETGEEDKPDIREKIMSLVDKIKGIYPKVSEKVEKIRNLYASLKKKEEAVMWFLREASTKHTIAVLKKQFFKLMKSILPKKITGELTLGLDDPGTMGQICMYAGMFYPMYEKHFKFTPVFTEKVIDGEVYVKGRIILGAILAHMARILLVPDFYRTLKNAKVLMRKIK